MKYRSDIDSLRAISVIAVIMFHLEISIFSGGFVGVDIFLVISGYLITKKLTGEIETNQFKFKHFYITRILRLLPAFLATAFFTTLLAILIFSATHLSNYGDSLKYALFSWSNNYFLRTIDYFSTSSKLMPLLHTWSLSLEEQFYLIWPMLLLLLGRTSEKKTKIILLILIGFSSFVLNIIFKDGSPISRLPEIFNKENSTIFYMLPFRVFEFILGGLIIYLPKMKNKKIANFLYLTGIILVFFSIFYFDSETVFPSWAALAPTIGAALAIWCGANNRFQGIISNKYLVYTGLLSYSLYLVHWPLIAFSNYIFSELSLVLSAIIILLTFVLGYLLNNYIEKPFRVKNFSYLSFGKKILFFGVILVLFTLSWSMKQHNGWPSRNSNKLNISSTSFHRKYYGGTGTPRNDYLKKEKRNIYLIGDSHARQYAKAINKLVVKKHQVGLYIDRYDCGFISFFKNPNTNICDVWIHELKQKLINEENPIVIFTLSYMKKIRLLQNLSEYGSDLRDVEFLGPGLVEFKKRLGIKKMIIIGQVPTAHGMDLYDQLTRPNWIASTMDDLRYKELIGDVHTINGTLKNFFTGMLDIVFINPEDIFCKNNICLNINENNELFYSDTNHLSIFGSEYFVIKSSLDKILFDKL